MQEEYFNYIVFPSFDKDMNLNFKVPDQLTFEQTVLNNLHRYYTDNAKKFKQDTRIFELISNINLTSPNSVFIF